MTRRTDKRADERPWQFDGRIDGEKVDTGRRGVDGGAKWAQRVVFAKRILAVTAYWQLQPIGSYSL